jgi:hypothetical protein
MTRAQKRLEGDANRILNRGKCTADGVSWSDVNEAQRRFEEELRPVSPQARAIRVISGFGRYLELA